jgi:hypothetical protein
MSGFTCARCGWTFDSRRPAAEAEAEAEALYGVPNASTDPTMVVICDDCFRKLRDWETQGDRRVRSRPTGKEENR